MTLHAIDERLHASALGAFLIPRLAPAPLLEYGEVPGLDGNPGPEPDLYALLHIERAAMPVLQASRVAGRTSWRITLRAVASTTNECRWLLKRLALDSERLQIDGRESTPLQHDVSEAARPDGSRFSAATTYTYTL